jgi:hypothetical protein
MEPERAPGHRRRRRKTKDFSWRPVGWTTGSGSSREYGEVDGICLALAQFPDSKPVVIWTSRHWDDRLALWWSLDNIQRTQFDVSRFTVATVQSQFASGDPQDADPFSISCVPAERLRIAFDARSPLSVPFLENGSSLWHKYANASPLGFDDARRKGCDEFPELRSAAEAHGWLYPRVSAGNSLTRLSLLDEAFLGGFSVDEWLTPWEALCVAQWTQAVLNEGITGKGEDTGSEASARHSRWETIVSSGAADVGLLRRLVEERVSCQKTDLITPVSDAFGSNPFTMRLHEWAVHQPGAPLLECRPGRPGTNPFTRVRFRLTPRARRLLDEGHFTLDDAPPMFAGGCEVYRREPCWIRCESADDWWLERR